MIETVSFFSGNILLAHLVHTWIWIMVIAAMICFFLGEITHNFSQVDKVWSLMPVIYAWVTVLTFPGSARLWVMTALVTLWGVRLTYNFSRKGGYSLLPWKGEEDYRWAVVRKNPLLKKRWSLTIFNLTFISFYQHVLIMLFSSPLLVAARFVDKQMSWLDVVAAVLMLVFIVIEAIADQQQHVFQRLKRHPESSRGTYAFSLQKGFLVEGLWRYVRHPNFAAEQAIWISFYLFSVSSSGKWLNETALGFVLLVLLFQASSALTEKISRSKYVDYAAYQQQVSKFIPRIFFR
jgi:steroid 5-alpha reductase family enzyme